MRNEQYREKLFSESVDLLLSGQAEKPEVREDPELISTLEFARKMTGLRAVPSAQFTARLKDKLLRDLEKQEAGSQRRERSHWFSWFMSHKPVWQAATAVFVVLIVIGVTWAAGVFDTGPVPVVSVPTATIPAGTIPVATTAAPATMVTTKPYPAATTAPVTTKPVVTTSSAISATIATGIPAIPSYIPGMLLAAGAVTDKPSYASGESVKIEFALRNVSLQPIVLEKLPPILSLMQTDTRRPVYTFRAGTESRMLAPGEIASYTLTWNQLDFNNRQVSSGTYYVELEDLDYQGKAVQLNLSAPARFEILPPEAMSSNTNTLLINQAQSAGGITITLQKIELSSRSLRIFAFITPPPDYILMQGASGLIPARDYNSVAKYCINGSNMRDAGTPVISAYSNGMDYSWLIFLDDMASARELVFNINQIGIWSGPWQFKVALK